MNQTAEYQLGSGKFQNPAKTRSAPVLNDRSPGYRDEGQLFELFEERLDAAVDEDRSLDDIYGVASTAIEIGLSRIEASEKDALDLIHQTWLETGKKQRLKQSLIDLLKTEVKRQEVEHLKQLPPAQLLERYREIKGESGEQGEDD